MDEQTWSRQKWWVQRAYMEGMSEDEEVPFEFFFDTTMPPDPVDASDDELAEMGIRVIHRG